MRLPLKLMLGGVLLVAAAAGGALTMPRGSEANIVAGEYSLEYVITPTSVATGAGFTVDVFINHSTANYQAAQWFLDYDETLVTPGVITPASAIRDGAAPAACGSASDNGVRVLLGCLDIFGANLSYSGVVWHVPFTCTAAGTATFGFGTLGTQTFVKIGSTNQTIHTHTDSLDCTGVSLTSTPTPTSTNTPVPPTNTPIPATSTATRAAPSASPTRAPREPFTDTPEPTETSTPAPEPTTAGGGGGGAVSTPTSPTGTGRPGGVISGPDTGTGPQEGSSNLLLIIFGGMAVAGIALFSAGAVAARRSR